MEKGFKIVEKFENRGKSFKIEETLKNHGTIEKSSKN